MKFWYFALWYKTLLTATTEEGAYQKDEKIVILKLKSSSPQNKTKTFKEQKLIGISFMSVQLFFRKDVN